MKHLWIPLLGAALLSSCVEGAAQQNAASASTILPDSLNQALLRDSELIADCKHEAVLANFAELSCVGIVFPPAISSSGDKEAFAADLTSHYGEAVASKGWTLTTDWKLLKVFEKAESDECSTKIKIMTWVVDETKPVETRNFETSRLAFIRDNTAVCGDKRKAPH